MLGSRHEIARLQSDFYRDRYRQTLRWLIVIMILIFLLIASIVYVVLERKPQQYYANTTEGKILRMPRQL